MAGENPTPIRTTLTPEERASRRRRSIAIGLALAAAVLLFYVLTIVKMGPGIILNRSL